jgi:RNA recognition motif-containing protein
MGARKSKDADNKPHKKKSKLKLKNADTKCTEEPKVLAKHGKTKKSCDEKDFDNPDHTIFVGNLPKDIEKKDVIKLFSQYGKIQSIRLRNAPIADTRTPKKVAVIK